MITPKEAIELSSSFYQDMKNRRSIRHFSNQMVNEEIIYNAIRTAGCSPSGANAQPWFFGVIFNQDIKKQIRIAAEKEETDFYQGRAGKQWLSDLEHLGTDNHKPYLEDAPCLIPIFSRTRITANNESHESKTYYHLESTCIATGMLITALHQSGLATLTHTPKPMSFLNKILNLDKTYKPVMILVTGYPQKPVLVPKLSRKPLNEISKTWGNI